MGGGSGTDDCQIGGPGDTPTDAPWNGAAREADKTRLWRYVCFEPQGVPFPKVVADSDLRCAKYAETLLEAVDG